MSVSCMKSVTDDIVSNLQQSEKFYLMQYLTFMRRVKLLFGIFYVENCGMFRQRSVDCSTVNEPDEPLLTRQGRSFRLLMKYLFIEYLDVSKSVCTLPM